MHTTPSIPNRKPQSRLFSGLRRNLELASSTDLSRSPKLFFLDIPFSLLVDTLLLPVDLLFWANGTTVHTVCYD